MSRLPDFFIVGAPKCGTTALFTYLAGHPGVFLPEVKEPHYFADDLRSPDYVRSEEAYRALFAAAGERQRVGEASVWYLFSRVAASRIRDAVPEARLIVMVRRGVDLFVSLHNQTLASLYEDERDPEKAWHLQETRRGGNRIPPLCAEPLFLQYDAACRLGGQLERLLEAFPRSQVHVIVFDDLLADTRAVCEDVLRFLGLPGDGREELPRVNVAHQPRVRWLEALRLRTDRVLRNRPGLAPATRWLRPAVRALRRWNVRTVEKAKLSDAFRRRLTRHFTPDVELLEGLIGRDLSAWKETGGRRRAR